MCVSVLQYEICRCFLAALQLAADGNVVISGSSSSDFSLTLHEGQLNDRVLQFTAPSVASAMKKRRNVARVGDASHVEATDAAALPIVVAELSCDDIRSFPRTSNSHNTGRC